MAFVDARIAEGDWRGFEVVGDGGGASVNYTIEGLHEIDGLVELAFPAEDEDWRYSQRWVCWTKAP